LEFVKKMINKK